MLAPMTKNGLGANRKLDFIVPACLVLIASLRRPAAMSLGPVLAEVDDAFILHEW